MFSARRLPKRKRGKGAARPLSSDNRISPVCPQCFFLYPGGLCLCDSLFGSDQIGRLFRPVALSGQRTFQFASWRKRPCFVPEFLCWPYGAFHRYRGHKGWGIFPFVAASGGVYLGMGWSVSTLPVSALLAGGRGTIRALSPALNFCMASFPLV